MKIIISNAGKRFNFEWILKNINYTLVSENSYAVIGPNGSGKSTLLQLISGSTQTSSGHVTYNLNGKNIEADEIYSYLTIAAPYLELIEEYNPVEMIQFQSHFKTFQNNLSVKDVLEISLLSKHSEKQIKNFSSGMKQRLKLSLAMLTNAPLVILDEPTTNLDQQGFEWYLKLMTEYSKGKLIVVGSNLEREIPFCNKKIDVMQFKNN